MSPVCIVGIGSPHGADRSGWLLIDALRQAGLERRFPGVRLHHCAVPAQLVTLLDGCRLALLVDAVEGAPECVLRLQREDLAGCDQLYSVHGFGVAEALDLVDTLLHPPPRVLLFAAGAGQLPELQAAIEQELAECADQ